LELELIYNDKLYQFVQDHLREDPALLLLKHHHSTELNVKEAVQQIAARQKAKSKLPTWTAHREVVFPSSLSLEQSSSEQTAGFKSRFVQGEKLVDLTGGFGVDTLILGENFREVTYIERQEKLAKIVAHNFLQLSENPQKYQVCPTDSMVFLEQSNTHFDWMYVDPARRGESNQKLFKLADCEPDVRAHWSLMQSKARNIMIKASPMLDIKSVLRELPDIKQVLVVAVKNELKEVLLLWEKGKRETEIKISAFDLGGKMEQRFDFTFEEEINSQASYGLPQEYLIEPNLAIMKSGAFNTFAHRFELMKLHPNTHLYTSKHIHEGVPGRIFQIIKEIKLDKKVLKQVFPSGKVNVIVRNHPLKAETIKGKYGLKDGGENFLVATRTVEGKARVYWCRKRDEGMVGAMALVQINRCPFIQAE
jgi:16S rRNA G966 N2-methylase RsmD